MGPGRRLLARVGDSSPASFERLDWVVAGGLTVGALIGLSRQHYSAPTALATACCIAVTSSVAWRRHAPILATLLAVAGTFAYQRLSGDQSIVFEAFAIALNFYLVGRRRIAHGFALPLATLGALSLAAFAGIASNLDGLTAANVIEHGGPISLVPLAAGAIVGRRTELLRRRTAVNQQLAREQDLRLAAAAETERSHLARELHDVVAHSVSVMVVQAGAARITAADEPDIAHAAVQVVIAAGREAITDLRRIVGVVHSDELLDSESDLTRLRSLVERVASAGLTTELVIDGKPHELAHGVEPVVYRVVQESLTNAAKHARPTHAVVRLSFEPDGLELTITDVGAASATPERDLTGSGQGLVGMRERVSSVGGSLRAGPRTDGGFQVRAWLPDEPRPSTMVERPPTHESWHRWWPRRDYILAALLIVAFEIEVLISRDHYSPIALSAVLVAAMALAMIIRRRSPLLFLIVVNVLAIPLSGGLTSIANATLVSTYLFAVPTYAVAAWSGRRPAAVGLLLALCVPVIEGPYWHIGASATIGDALPAVGVWVLGRIAFSQRSLATEVDRTSAQLVTEREDRERLIIASERTRMVRDLHALVARGVVAMVVRAEAIAAEFDVTQAMTALAIIESTGREALVQMRSILGILRAPYDPIEFSPTPGLDQIHHLVQSSRTGGRSVALTVSGEPGPLPGGIDVVAYRILEDLLVPTTGTGRAELAITVRFLFDQLELELVGRDIGPPDWPSPTIRDCITQCDGQIVTTPGTDPRLTIRLPRNLEASLT